MDKMQESQREIEASLEQFEFLRNLQEKTGVQKSFIALGMVSVFGVIIYFIFGPGLVCNLVGFVGPAYWSFKAIESADKDDDTQWLTYWTVFAFFSLFETFSDTLAHYIPFYWAMKFGFLIWLFAPQTQGAVHLYKSFLRPFLLNHQAFVDSKMNAVSKAASDVREQAEEIREEQQ